VSRAAWLLHVLVLSAPLAVSMSLLVVPLKPERSPALPYCAVWPLQRSKDADLPRSQTPVPERSLRARWQPAVS
jgi:hypothetical protein